jgi:ubiquinone/menaquinone biosynthesis C-methylase UbiE
VAQADTTEQDDRAERDERYARGYDRWWAPVLAPSALALLELLDPTIAEGGAADVLDLGVGTGNLALAAVTRWPGTHVTGIDVSSDMVRTVEALATERLAPTDRARFSATPAPADELPFDDGSFDVVMSSFVLQLVASRAKVLREVRRVLRPGGVLAYVTWLRSVRAFAPDRVFDELLDEFGYDEEPGDDRAGDLPSVDTAAAEVRRAGFRDVSAAEAPLRFAFDADSYIGFLVEFDEESLFEEMGRADRRRFLAQLRERLMALPPDDFVFQAPIVYVSGRRSA